MCLRVVGHARAPGVGNRGALTVSFSCIELILMRISLFEKSALKRKASLSSTSLPLGLFCSTRTLPHASDCRVRRSSPSSVQGWEGRAKGVCEAISIEGDCRWCNCRDLDTTITTTSATTAATVTTILPRA
jgi:hypothetical protein